MITGLSDRELLNALANIKRGMGISLYHRYVSSAPPIGSIASTVKNRRRKTKKKKGGRRKKRTRKKRGGVGYDDEGYFVKYNTPELLEYARKNRLEQKYLFQHKYNNKLEHIWLTWNEYENIKRDIDLYNLNNYDNLNASEIPQMMNTIFPQEQIAIPNLVTIEPIFKKPIIDVDDLKNEFMKKNISVGLGRNDGLIDTDFESGYVRTISEQNLLIALPSKKKPKIY